MIAEEMMTKALNILTLDDQAEWEIVDYRCPTNGDWVWARGHGPTRLDGSSGFPTAILRRRALKPQDCPNCSTPLALCYTGLNGDGWHMICTLCGLTAPKGRTKDEAVALGNRITFRLEAGK